MILVFLGDRVVQLVPFQYFAYAVLKQIHNCIINKWNQSTHWLCTDVELLAIFSLIGSNSSSVFRLQQSLVLQYMFNIMWSYFFVALLRIIASRESLRIWYSLTSAISFGGEDRLPVYETTILNFSGSNNIKEITFSVIYLKLKVKYS